MRRCAPLFRTSETAGRIALKFDVWLVDHYITAITNILFLLGFRPLDFENKNKPKRDISAGAGFGAYAYAYAFHDEREKMHLLDEAKLSQLTHI